MNQELKNIVNRYIHDFDEKSKKFPFIVRPSIPIVWFGNLEKYLNSNKKILTVGYSPSKHEFDGNRFDINNYNDVDALAKTLNEYFIKQPYLDYFNNFENVIQKVNASYWDNYFYTAIHINMYTAIATDDADQRKKIKDFNLFKELLTTLNPDIIISAMSNSNLKTAFSFVFDIEKPVLEIKVDNNPKQLLKKYKSLQGNQILINGKTSVPIRGAFYGMSNKGLEEAVKSLQII